jgi:CDP-diglyceride synthetase
MYDKEGSTTQRIFTQQTPSHPLLKRSQILKVWLKVWLVLVGTIREDIAAYLAHRLFSKHKDFSLSEKK